MIWSESSTGKAATTGPFRLDVWIAMHEDLKTSRRMRLMFDHLAEEMTAYTREAAR